MSLKIRSNERKFARDWREMMADLLNKIPNLIRWILIPAGFVAGASVGHVAVVIFFFVLTIVWSADTAAANEFVYRTLIANAFSAYLGISFAKEIAPNFKLQTAIGGAAIYLVINTVLSHGALSYPDLRTAEFWGTIVATLIGSAIAVYQTWSE
jgi:hypothetical protein